MFSMFDRSFSNYIDVYREGNILTFGIKLQILSEGNFETTFTAAQNRFGHWTNHTITFQYVDLFLKR